MKWPWCGSSHFTWTNVWGKIGSLANKCRTFVVKQTSQDYGELLANPGITLRSLFISDPCGFVTWVPVVHCHGKKKVFRLVETHGEVCPATGRHNPLWPKQVQLLPEPFRDLCVPEACQVTGDFSAVPRRPLIETEASPACTAHVTLCVLLCLGWLRLAHGG